MRLLRGGVASGTANKVAALIESLPLPIISYLAGSERVAMRVWHPLAFFASAAPLVFANVNFDTCLADIHQGLWGDTGGTDNYGNPVSNISQATAITYGLCIKACGAGSEPFDWNIFSQQFSAWLLPYLALISQLPFGAQSRLDNLVSMLLTLGSPTLAAYSLALTVLNGHWIAQRFSHIRYPNVKEAVKILSSLQQSALRVVCEESLLASLVVLHENDDWWSELSIWLNYVHTWSISAVASIIWVVTAYIFTVVDSFTSAQNTNSTLNANGQAIGSIFLWLLPVVVGWLQISPKCDHDRVHQALDRANKMAYVASDDGEPILASKVSRQRAIYLQKRLGEIHRDQVKLEQSTAPIYNYARFLPWAAAVEDVYLAFREASERTDRHEPVDKQGVWEHGDRHWSIHPRNRRGSTTQVSDYVKMRTSEIPSPRRSRLGPGVLARFLLASILAICLTWGSVGAAVLVAFFTPTKGIACRSGSYLLYGTCSTLVWMLLVISSGLAHYASFAKSYRGRYIHTRTTRVAGILAITLRRVGKILAALNSAWILAACLFQFGSFFDRCWCNRQASVFYLGKDAYNVISISTADVAALNAPWIGEFLHHLNLLSFESEVGVSILFMAFVSVLINPNLPDM
ncbi:unnamed protein product [Mycena citricolor]|uniref:Uncharacterized protein n=1 Tax=Mycena citricolor TaxID=2018698 RepID=A0AAD2GR53_9AGAR|nr:unnamed protein product [Mycena citricolor]